jgi:hypothetical protein
MHPSPNRDEAAALLAEVDSARAAMRHAIRAHRGHLHLWIWGAAWVAMPLTVHFGGSEAGRFFPWICLAAGTASVATGFTQGRQVRTPVNFRFLGVLAAVLGFAALFPFVLQASFDLRTSYAYACLVAMQTYVVAGLWTDTYLLWLGIAVTVLILIGLLLFPSVFWLWMAAFGGGPLIATGFYVRHCWR